MTTTPNKSNKSKVFNQLIKRGPSKSWVQIKQRIYKEWVSNYRSTPLTWGANIITNIIYNEKSHIVARFKDYLIIDDNSEFLKRYYRQDESEVRLPKFFEYYETYSKIYPNYTSLNEGQYIYHNIQRKQRMIDLQEKMEFDAKKREELLSGRPHYKKESGKNKDYCDEVFRTDVYDSILNDRNNEDMELIFGIDLKKMQSDEDAYVTKIQGFIEAINNADLSQENKKKYDDFLETRFWHGKFRTISNNISKSSNNYEKELIEKKVHGNGKNSGANIITSMNEMKNNWNCVTQKNMTNKKNNSEILSNFGFKKTSENNNTKMNPKTERNLIERLEYNWLKISEKSEGKQGRNDSNNSATNRVEISKNWNYNYPKKSPNKNITNYHNNFSNIPLSHRGNKNTVTNVNISNITDLAIPAKSPITERNYYIRNLVTQNNNVTVKNNSSSKKYSVLTNSNTKVNSARGNKEPIFFNNTVKTTNINTMNNTNANPISSANLSSSNNAAAKCTNNIIYIINQNPKFTTHVTYYNNNNNNNHNNNSSGKTTSQPQKNVTTSQAQCAKVNTAKKIGSIINSFNNNQGSSKVKQKSNLYNINVNYKNILDSNIVKNNNPVSNTHNVIVSQEKSKNKSNNSSHNTIFSNSNSMQNKIKKGNSSTLTNSSATANTSKYNNNSLLKAAKDIGYKEINILRNCSQVSMGTYRDTSNTKETNIITRNKRTDSVTSRNSSKISNNSINNKYTKNDSINKMGFMDTVNINKNIVKGIHIKNFSKVFSINMSQPPKTDRFDNI